MFKLLDDSDSASVNNFFQFESFPDPNLEHRLSVLKSIEEGLKDLSHTFTVAALILGSVIVLLMFRW